MKKIFSKKYVITLISSFTVGTGIILACSGDWGDDLSSSNFTPEAFTDSTYRPFFYAGYSFYYGIGYDNEHSNRFDESNIDDWASFLGKPVLRDEVGSLLYTSTTGSIDSALGYLTGKLQALPSAMQSLQVFRNKKNKKLTAFITWLS